MLQLAGPLEVDDDGEIIRYNDMNDREGEQEHITQEFLLDVLDYYENENQEDYPHL